MRSPSRFAPSAQPPASLREQITEATKIGRSTLYRIERGERVPDMVQLAQIASVLPVTVEQIIARATERMVIDPGITPES